MSSLFHTLFDDVPTGLTAEITSNPYTIVFKSKDRALTWAGEKHQALFDIPSRWTMNSASNSSCLALDPASNPVPAKKADTIRYLHSELNLAPGELVYGFGEQFGAFVKNGAYNIFPGVVTFLNFVVPQGSR